MIPATGSWATATFSDWLGVPEDDAGEVHLFRRTAHGWAVVWTKEDLGFDPSGGGHAKWVLAFFRSPADANPFLVVPGCRVSGVLLHSLPVGTPGFRDLLSGEQEEARNAPQTITVGPPVEEDAALEPLVRLLSEQKLEEVLRRVLSEDRAELARQADELAKENRRQAEAFRERMKALAEEEERRKQEKFAADSARTKKAAETKRRKKEAGNG